MLVTASTNAGPTRTATRASRTPAAQVASPRCDDGSTDPASSPGSDGSVRPVRVGYRQLGSGSPVVVLIHGGLGVADRQMLPAFASLTRTGLRLVYYDQRGVGDSPAPADDDYSPDAYVADLEALRVRLGRTQRAGAGLRTGPDAPGKLCSARSADLLQHRL